MDDLIKFPEDGSRWKDSGEGGTYVMAAIPRPAGHPDHCTMENFIVLTAPDAVVSDVSAFWPDPVGRLEEEQARYDAARLMEQKGFPMKAAMVRSLISEDSLSLPVLCAVEMGSVGRIMKDREGDGYWEAGQIDLTPSGAALMVRLHDAFGVAPTLLTFLDT